MITKTLALTAAGSLLVGLLQSPLPERAGEYVARAFYVVFEGMMQGAGGPPHFRQAAKF